MAYTTPRTWATNDAISAARLNQDLRDNPAFLATPPSCRVYNSAAISHTTSGTDQALTFNSERFDTDTMHSTSSNTSRITFTTAGKYLVGGNIEFAGSANGTYRYIGIRLGGTTFIALHTHNTSAAANPGLAIELAVTTYYAFTAGQYVELVANQNTGGALNVNSTSAYSPEFWAVWQSL